MPPFEIPDSITVHLGAPDEAAQNVTVSFLDYIKNVASSEIYPTWPENALRANILAQISFALNRIFTEYYPSRGYNFDITNSTRFDQSFIPNRDIFENISLLVDDIYNDYITRQGSVAPLFAQYCNGTTVTCDGLSQWGSVSLAQQGQIPYEILQSYYGQDISLVFNAPVSTFLPSYPGAPLRFGDAGEEVRVIQDQLNRIARNYPLIPKITTVNGIFDTQTEAAVRAFQDIFDLSVDGIVGQATWYAIKRVYFSVRRLSEITGEIISPEDLIRLYPGPLSVGDSGRAVAILQYYLGTIAFFDPTIPLQTPTGNYTEETAMLLRTFQATQGLPQTGVVDRATWNRIVFVYDTIGQNFPDVLEQFSGELYPGRVLFNGTSGADVRRLQEFLNLAAQQNPDLPTVSVDGIFGAQTEAAVRFFQRYYGLGENGLVGPIVWNSIVRVAKGLPPGANPLPSPIEQA